MSEPVKKLERQLLREIPPLEHWLKAAQADHGGPPTNEYWLFSLVVRPYIEALNREKSEAELREVWGVLERVAASGTESERNELGVTLEELDLWHFYGFMGPLLRSWWLDMLTWYPTHRTRTEPMNTHIDPGRYRRRWLDEIHAIGGFTKLSTEQQHRIAARLVAEFKLEPWTD